MNILCVVWSIRWCRSITSMVHILVVGVRTKTVFRNSLLKVARVIKDGERQFRGSYISEWQEGYIGGLELTWTHGNDEPIIGIDECSNCLINGWHPVFLINLATSIEGDLVLRRDNVERVFESISVGKRFNPKCCEFKLLKGKYLEKRLRCITLYYCKQGTNVRLHKNVIKQSNCRGWAHASDA